jgi:GT2 family glycosyltransferase
MPPTDLPHTEHRTPLASIVVLNLDGRRHLPPLLAHLAQQTQRDFELIFVDNGSRDDSVALIEQGCCAYGIPLRLIRNLTNQGFAPACNQGLARARAPWVAMLNNDTRPEPQWLEALLAAGETDPGVGMVASKMLRFAHPDQIDSAGIAGARPTTRMRPPSRRSLVPAGARPSIAARCSRRSAAMTPTFSPTWRT